MSKGRVTEMVNVWVNKIDYFSFLKSFKIHDSWQQKIWHYWGFQCSPNDGFNIKKKEGTNVVVRLLCFIWGGKILTLRGLRRFGHYNYDSNYCNNCTKRYILLVINRTNRQKIKDIEDLKFFQVHVKYSLRPHNDS